MALFETEQEFTAPVTANVNPVVDNTFSTALSGAVDVTERVFAVQDNMALSEFEEELQSLEQKGESDDAERLAIISGYSSGEKVAVEDADKRLSRLSKSVRQGVLSEAAADVKKLDLLRRKIADKPWLSTEYQSLAKTYGVSGMRSTGKSSDDPIIKAQNAYLQAATKLQMLPGLSLDAKVLLLQRATLSDAQFQQISAMSKAEHLPQLQDHAGVHAWKLSVEMENYINSVGPGFDKNQAKALVDKSRGELKRDLKSNVARYTASGIPMEYTDAEIDNIVDNATNFYTAVIAQNDPAEMVKQMQARNQLSTQQGYSMMKQNNALLDSVFRAYSVYDNPDPRAVENAMKTYSEMYRAREKAGGKFTTTLKNKEPKWAHIFAFLENDPAAYMDRLRDENQNGRGFGNPVDAEMTVVQAKAHLSGANGAGPMAAFNAAVNSPTPMIYDAFLGFTPTDGRDNPSPDQMMALLNKMNFDLNAASAIFASDWTVEEVGSTLPELDPASMGGEVGAQATYTRPKYQIVYDDSANRFTMWNVNKNMERVSEVQSTDHRRLMIALNKQLRVRDKFNMWDTNKQEFVARFTQGITPYPQTGGGFYEPYVPPTPIDRSLNTGALVRGSDGRVVGTEPFRKAITPPLLELGDVSTPSTEGINIPRGGIGKILKDNMAVRDAVLGTDTVSETWEVENGTWVQK